MTPPLKHDTPPALASLHRVGPYSAGGAGFVIDVDDEVLAVELNTVLVDLRSTVHHGRDVVFTIARRHPASATHPWEVWRDQERCEQVTDDYLVPYVLWEITRLLLDQAGAQTALHAAAVAHEGRAIVLAGESQAGKSTLAGWLTAHGWEFLTDEVAVIERRDDGVWWVKPFTRPIGVRHPSPLDPLLGDRVAQRPESLVPASHLGRLSDGAALTAIVLPRRRPGQPSALVGAHPATAVRSLVAHLPLRKPQGRDGFRSVVSLALEVPAFTLDVDDLSAAHSTVTALIDGGTT